MGWQNLPQPFQNLIHNPPPPQLKWLFRLAASPVPSFLNLTVVPGHAVFDDFSGAFSLDLLGAAVTLRGLTPGTPYFARCLAKNSAVGWSRPAATVPAAEVPRAAPPPPARVAARVLGSTSLELSWPPAAVRGDRVRDYLVEVSAFWPTPAV